MKRSGPLQRRTPLNRVSKTKRTARPGVPKDVLEAVVRRDGGCVARALIPSVFCWGRLDPHHLVRRSQGGPDTATNLKTLCRAHHSYVHDHPAEAYDLDLLRRPTPPAMTD